jgi:hypothetical protein
MLGFGVVVLGAAVLSAQAASSEKKPAMAAHGHKAAAAGHAVAAGDLKWVDVPDLKGAQIAVVWGDPKTGAYSAFEKWPAGTDAGVHTHTSDLRAVVVSGTMGLAFGSGPEKDLTAGSWAHTLANEVHHSKCKAGADCIFFVTQTGKADLIPAEEKK